MHEYQVLKIRIERDPAGGFKTYADGPSGEAPGSFRLPLPEDELMKKVEELGRRVRAAPGETLAAEFGEQLFDALFQDRIRDIYHESYARAQAQGKGLRVTLGLTEVPELMQLPWEFLYHEQDFLAISDWTPVVRYLDLPTSHEPLPIEPPLRILAMVSSPTDTVPLDVEREKENLERALSELVKSGAVEILWLEKATLNELMRTLRRGKYHVFHFIGHGAFDPNAKDGLLLLEDERARGRYVRGWNLGRTLANHKSLRLAVLNSCEGGRASDDDPFAGVASSLVRAQIPAVLAMQFEITDRAAAIFASGFYESLADGYPVDTALSQARLAIFNDSNPLEWGTPILLMRVEDGRLFDVTNVRPRPHVTPSPPPPPPEEEKPTPPKRRPPPPPPSRRERVARWLSARRWYAAAAGALLLLLLAAVTAFFLVTDGPSDAWSRVDAEVLGGEGQQEMRAAVALAGGTMIAVGRNGTHPSVWTYDDGDWAPRRDLPETGLMNGVAARGGVVVGVGWSPGEDPDAGIWKRSRTGAWSAAPCAGCAEDNDQLAYAVTFRRDGSLVAVGRRTGSSDGKFDAAVWLSTDAEEWQAAGLEDADLGGNDSQVMNDVMDTADGLVAVGRDGPDAAVWTSDDGEDWTRVRESRLVSPVEFLEMYALARVGTRLIAVGWKQTQGRPNVAATWISFDRGSTWRAGTSPDFSARGQKMRGVIVARQTPSETVAVGFDHRGGRPVAAAWSSRDGERWTPVESPSFAVGERAEMSAIAVLSDGTVVGVGESGPDGDADAAIWTSTAYRSDASPDGASSN